MEKDIGKIKKNETTDIIVRIDDFGGRVGLTIREFTTSDRYTGFTKSGTRIPAESVKEFKEIIKSIDEGEIEAAVEEVKKDGEQQTIGESVDEKQENSSKIKEEVF